MGLSLFGCAEKYTEQSTHCTMGIIVFNRLLGNGWSDLDNLFGIPHEIAIPMKW